MGLLIYLALQARLTNFAAAYPKEKGGGFTHRL
jgi:hypothetical protein